MRLLFLLLIVLISHPALAAIPTLNVNLTDDHVDITTGFNGERLTLFGVRREKGDVVLVVRGPGSSVTVRRKEQVLGIWMNNESVTFENVPLYYDVAMSNPLDRIAGPDVMAGHEIGLSNMEFRYTGQEDEDVVDRFREALIRTRQQHGLFPLEPRKIRFMDGNFFRADFYLPPNVPTGIYTIDAYLFKNGQISSLKQTTLRVAQVGFNARLYDFANRGALLYGLAAVFLAFGTGWVAHYFLRRE